ncbi:MAG: hypothetical protein AB7P40_25460 [Chloroflexota bacterium]
MQQQDDRARVAATVPDPPETAHEVNAETDLDEVQTRTGGGQRYQEGHRLPGDTEAGAPRTSAGVGAPDQEQRGEEYGGPTADEEATLHEQGYPKLGRKLPSKVTQVEHGPYAGGTQQGDTKADRPD